VTFQPATLPRDVTISSNEVTVIAVNRADLSIAKTTPLTSVSAGATVAYTLTVRNAGPLPATASVSDILPENLTFVSATLSKGGACSVVGALLTCPIGLLAVIESATIQIVMTARETGDAINVAHVETLEPNRVDPNLENNTDFVETAVIGEADLLVDKVQSAETLQVGQTQTCTITVRNNGRGTATNVTLTDDLWSDRATLVSVTASQGSCTGTTAITCALGTLNVNASATVTLVVRTTSPGPLLNATSVTGTEPDPNPGDNIDDTGAIVTPPPGPEVQPALREAIQAANNDAAFGGCTAGNGDDTITLQALTYTLTIPGANNDLNQTGDLDIRSNITINGVEATSTIIDGGTLDRVVDVLFGTAFSIANVTIRNGSVNGTGGGIDNSGVMTIADSTISGNTATGSSGGGGGIDNNSSGTLTITNSTISGNAVTGSSGNGGGIDNSGTLTLTNSTVSGNLASGNAGRGGGIANQNGTANVTFTTITGNSATKGGGGILANGGQVNLRATIVETSPLESTCDEKSGGDIDSQGSNVADDIKVGDYLEADGEKQHEQLFHADSRTRLHATRDNPPMPDAPRTELTWDSYGDPRDAVATAGAYVVVDGRFAFAVGPTTDGTSLAVYRLGGRREPGETPWQCAERELLEEAGLRIHPRTPPRTYWFQLCDDASQIDALVERHWPPRPEAPTPIFVARGIGANVNRLSAMYLAIAEGSPEPLNETHGLIFLTPAEVFAILNRPLTLRQYLRAGGRVILRPGLPDHLPLEPHLQLQVLGLLLNRHSTVAS